MSRNVLDDLLLSLVRDEELRHEFSTDRAGVLARFHLSDQERKALLELDADGLAAAAVAVARPCAPAAIV